jgi:hypothetical protein
MILVRSVSVLVLSINTLTHWVYARHVTRHARDVLEVPMLIVRAVSRIIISMMRSVLRDVPVRHIPIHSPENVWSVNSPTVMNVMLTHA